MFDLHIHSLLSDGVLLPSEVAQRYQAAGIKIIAITDHVDYSNIDNVVGAILKFTQNWPKNSLIKVLPGVELTHLPLEQFKPLADYARSKGIKIIVAHGESPVEPVIKGTNRAALEADIDILAHPGLICDDDILLAKSKGIFLEITARQGHNKTNAYVAKNGLKLEAKLIIQTDSHKPEDILTYEQLKKVGLKAGIKASEIELIFQNLSEFLRKREAV